MHKLIAFTLAVVVVSIYFVNYLPKSCLVEAPKASSKIFREPEHCDICESVTNIEKITNVSIETFYETYIKRAKPVVVSDAAKAWPALTKFNFEFFKSVYQDNNLDLNSNAKKRCQFFPYKTEFDSLGAVFEMDSNRANLKPGTKPWYVGWSNCNDASGRVLGKFYNKPYFLSENNRSESISLTWIFMGGPGKGAHMHVDDVMYPSWQAQLKGRKLWKLAPPPECYFQCYKARELSVVVDPGDIIVLDTNKWYHETHVLPDQVSVTIGSEFD